jgi:predicted O-methyltransferase YrrM
LLDSTDSLEVTDYGAGSLHNNDKFRKVSSIARMSLTPPKYASLYRSLVLEYKAKTVIELGTSLGITTLYLSPPGTRTITFEGAGTIAQVARRIFQEAGLKTIEIVVGNIETTLPQIVTRIEAVDVLFMDAHHRYDATVQYFNVIEPLLHFQSIAIIDDIHYSYEMEQAWMFFKSHPRVFATVDLFRCGLVFFDPSLNRQHVVLEY